MSVTTNYQVSGTGTPFPGGVVSAGQPIILGVTSTVVTRNSANAAGDATYSSLYTTTVPGGIMGANGQFYFIATVSQTNSASTKAYRLDVNGTQMSQEATYTTSAAITKLEFPWWNKNSETVNEVILGGAPIGGATGIAPAARAIDTTADMTVTFNVKWTGAVAGESISLLKAYIMIIPGL